MNIDEFIERAQESAKKHRYHADFFDINNPMRAVCIKSAEDCEQLAEWLEKSKEYQHLEEQDRLVKLPCKDVYFVIDINNPKYAMVMKTLTIDEAAEYSNIGINRINDMLNNPSCPFVLFVGRGKRLVKRREFEKYLEKTDSI